MDGLKTIVSFWGPAYFQVLLLFVSGSVCCTPSFQLEGFGFTSSETADMMHVPIGMGLSARMKYIYIYV